MTDVAFHFGAPDKLAYVCRLLRKAYATQAHVLVVGETTTIAQLDTDLWAVSAVDFVAHCTASASATERKRSAVLLGTSTDAASGPRQVLVNLLPAVPPDFAAFARVIEVVSTDEADRMLARQRWKHYTELGYAITRHDLHLKGSQ